MKKVEWQTVFRNETGWSYKTQREKQVRMVYVDDVEAGEIVCRILGHPDVKVQENRARLIAAAPDLLEACKHGLDKLREYNYVTNHSVIYEMGEVIAQAEKKA